MAYINANEVKEIREQLKARFPNLKFGCRKGSGSLSVDVTIKSGDIDFFENYNRVVSARPGAYRGGQPAEKSMQVNQYWLSEHFEGVALETLQGVMDVIKTAPSRKWYDKSDAMTDYFDTAFYIHLNIGEWNKPYQLTE